MNAPALIARISCSILLLLAATAAVALNPNHQCGFCHNLHGLVPPQNLGENLCLTCHGAGGISTLKAAVHTNDTPSSYPAFRITCLACHDPHSSRQNWLGTINIKLVGTRQDGTGLARILTPRSGVREVVLRSRGTTVGEPKRHSFADDDDDGNGYRDGICETCHTLTKHHRNNAPANHNDGKTCTDSCHLHTAGFLR